MGELAPLGYAGASVVSLSRASGSRRSGWLSLTLSSGQTSPCVCMSSFLPLFDCSIVTVEGKCMLWTLWACRYNTCYQNITPGPLDAAMRDTAGMRDTTIFLRALLLARGADLQRLY